MPTTTTISEKIGPGSSHGFRRLTISEHLLVEIMRARIPGGTWLVEQDMAQQYKVSRTPIREALRELMTLGVVELVPNHGARTLEFGPAQLRDLYQVREVLEAASVRMACPHLPEPLLEEMAWETQALLDPKLTTNDFSKQWIPLDLKFHTQVAAHCGNPRMAVEISRHTTIVQAIRKALGKSLIAQRRAAREHLAIIQAIQNRDARKAQSLMRIHIRHSAKTVIAAMWPQAQLSHKK